MDDIDLIIDLHRDAERQGPGGEAQTRLAIELSGLRRDDELRVADIGCGTGAATHILQRELNARISAVDLHPDFLDVLNATANQAGYGDRVTTVEADMTSLNFGDEELDVIWSEGAIYSMGFEAGLADWRRFLKPGGILAVSELTWLTETRPAELTDHWMAAYPEVAPASTKIAQLERHGYAPLGYFALPTACWLENYYHPLEQRFDAFIARHSDNPSAKAIVDAEKVEISLYKRFSDFVSYGFYIARKI